uniref:Uncharacterized protein n=1 Tax=Salix viminalis TaxID=40686 RepID=A0A6N2L392_SALVM
MVLDTLTTIRFMSAATIQRSKKTPIRWWDGNGRNHGGRIEGIADFVRLKANYPPNHWVKTGQARFLDYSADLRNGWVAELNKMMREVLVLCSWLICWGRLSMISGQTTKHGK